MLNPVIDILLTAGFTRSGRQGFIGFARGKQRCDIFQWSRSDRIEGLLYACITQGRYLGDGGRHTVPLSFQGRWRKPDEIASDFRSQVLPLLETI